MNSLRDVSIRWKVGLHLFLILLLILAHVGGVWWFLQEQKQDGTAINEAGKQRYIAEQMALQSQQIMMGDVAKREDLENNAAEFDRKLTALIEGNETMGIPPAPPNVREQLRTVETEWEPFYEHVQVVVAEPRTSSEFAESVAYILDNRQHLLESSDRAVHEYERDFGEKIDNLQTFLLGLLMVDLIVIAVLAGMVNRHIIAPINRTSSEAEAVARGNLEQPITRADADDEIGRLSQSLHEMKAQLVSKIQDVERFERAVEQAGHAIFITDTDGTIEYVNPAFEDITGFDEAEAVGETPRILKSGEQSDDFYMELWGAILDGEVWDDEIVNRRSTGELFYVDQTIAPITDLDGSITNFVAIQSDISEQRLREQRLSVLNRILRHNIRNGMTVIEGNASLCAETTDDQTLSTYSREIKAQAEEIIEISRDAGTAEKIVRMGPETTSSVDVTSMVSSVERKFDRQHPDATISVSTPDTAYVKADFRLEDALWEAVDNAVEHNDRTDPTVTITVTLAEASPPGEWIEIDVADNGPGIPDNEQLMLEKGEETPLFHGTGLGLWLIYWTVTVFGGELDIGENEPHGSVVTFRLPVATE
ncbi:MAG: PAS domain S-box protein [archaeon]